MYSYLVMLIISRKIYMFILLILLTISISSMIGCALSPGWLVLGSVTSKSANSETTIKIKNEPEKIMNIAYEVGKSLGYDAPIGIQKDCLPFFRKSSEARELFTGIITITTLTVIKRGDELNIKVSMTGDFGTGGQEYADKTLKEFKERLLEKIK